MKNALKLLQNPENLLLKAENRGKSRVNMGINNVELPIEQRNTGKGNPNAVLQYGTELNNKQKKL